MTDRTDFAEARRTLLMAAMQVSPTSAEQISFTGMVNQMLGAGEDERAVCAEIASAISDGLRHGNWPTTGNPQRPPMTESTDSPVVDTGA